MQSRDGVIYQKYVLGLIPPYYFDRDEELARDDKKEIEKHDFRLGSLLYTVIGKILRATPVHRFWIHAHRHGFLFRNFGKPSKFYNPLVCAPYEFGLSRF